MSSFNINIPGDTSSAAFIIVAATIIKKSEVLIKKVLINPRRTGIISALIKMGANIIIFNKYFENNELVGDIIVKSAKLKGVIFSGDEIVYMIDELPILAVAATQANGTTIIKDAQELIFKESNRIESITIELKKMNADIISTFDGFIINGAVELIGTNVKTQGDHRIAMSLVIAGLFANGETKIVDSEVIDDSFPNFVKCINSIGANVKEINYD